jgi:pimeloyl-ACP methyl ester carboxylesterase
LSDGFIYDDINLRQHATDFVCSLLDTLEIDRANVVAASVGGYFAFAAALDQPERFRKLVFAGYPLGIEGTRPVWRSPPVIRNLLLVGGIPGFGKLFKLMLSGMDAEGAREMYADQFNVDVSKYPDQYFVAYAAALQLPGAAESFVSFAKRCFRLRGLTPQADLSDDLSGLEVPSLFLWGEHDIAPPRVGREAVARIPAANFEVVDGAGHYPFNDVPDWTADRIIEFFLGCS